jgi:hypothetical protein
VRGDPAEAGAVEQDVDEVGQVVGDCDGVGGETIA